MGTPIIFHTVHKIISSGDLQCCWAKHKCRFTLRSLNPLNARCWYVPHVANFVGEVDWKSRQMDYCTIDETMCSIRNLIP